MTAAITATVTDSVSMAGAPFSSVSNTISGISASIGEDTFPSTSSTGSGGTPVSLYGFGGGPASKVGLLYGLSDSADVDLIFSGAGGTPVTIRLSAGVPKVYNIAGGIANPIVGPTGNLSATVTNNGTQGVSTDVHVRVVWLA